MTDHEINRELTHASWRAARPLFLALAIVGLCMWAAFANAGGTVTDSKYIWLQRSGVTLTETTSPKLACPAPKTMLECAACMAEMVDEEIRRRTSGYVTYRCMDVTQKYAKFNTTLVPPKPPVVTPPPPTASLQVYACADAGADGRLLERLTAPVIEWPNCSTATYQNPSRSLVVATNDNGVLLWRLASKVTSGRVWTQTGTVGAWTPVGDINWGTVSTPTGTATLTWTAPTLNTDGSALTNLAGYRIVYGTSASALNQIVEVSNPSILAYKIEALQPATYYFAIKSYTSAGVESDPSGVVSLVIK